MAEDNIFQEIADIVNKQRAAFTAELPVSKEVRIDRLNRAIDLLLDNKQAFIDAINQDYGQRTEEITLFADVLPSLQSLKHARKNVKKWMKKEKRSPTFPLALLGTKTYIDYKPKGVVGIISPWNFPLNMIFAPLAGALAAGNRVIIKPSEHVPATSELTRKLFSEYFAPEEIMVFTGGIDVADAFTRQNLDHMFYTGSGMVGRIVMKAAAENLVPVTLELGGKSPTVIMPGCNIESAAKRIVSAKMANAGQICVAPDYVFVERGKLPALVNAMISAGDKFYPEKPERKGAVCYTSVVNGRQKSRLESYITDAEEKGAVIRKTDSYSASRNDNVLPLHVISQINDDMTIMKEEIFGPLLPVLPYDSLDDVISYINARPRPLALYVLGQGDQAKDIEEKVIAGGMAYDEFLLHVGQEDLPFGGSGQSGMGHYHGIEGFKTFSHSMSVFKRGPIDVMGLLQARPPFGFRFRAYLKQELRK